MGKMIDFYDIFKKIIAIDEEILNWNELEKSVSCKLIHCLYVKSVDVISNFLKFSENLLTVPCLINVSALTTTTSYMSFHDSDDLDIHFLSSDLLYYNF